MSRLKQFVRTLVAGALAVSVFACVTVPPEEDPVLIKLSSLESRIVQSERVLENQGLVSLVTELQQVRSELAGLRDQVETLTFESENSRKRQRDLYVDIDKRLNSLERGLSVATTAPGGGVQTDADGTGVGPAFANDRDAYKHAFGLLEEGRYKEAGEAFAAFVTTYTDSPLLDNAQYWLAEALYVERDFAGALREFTRVVEAYPQSRKVPDALLKVGYAQYELKQWAKARAALDMVTTQHSDSTAARLAAQRLERMRNEGR